MKSTILSAVPILLALAASPSLASPTLKRQSQSQSAGETLQTTLSYDPKYDVATTSLNTVACSDGVNGLERQGYTTFGSVPGFPNIGGSPTIPGWNSPKCGQCYELQYQPTGAGGVVKSIYVTAVDAAPGGFNIGLKAMNALTDGLAQQLGRVDVTYSEANRSLCGFN